MLVDFGRGNLLQKARQQPDKVRQVLEKARTDGIPATLSAVRHKLDTPLPLGYCNVGRVVEVGAGVCGYAVGDRVVSNGKHAEFVAVPKNLCARIPDTVSDDNAAFTIVGAIALQGMRLLQPTLGETVVVTGLGLIGLIAVQLLRAHGCRVIGIDFDSSKTAQARAFGAQTVDLGHGEDPISAAQEFTRGRGVDAVLITASTSSNEPIHQAATMCRQRGRIVLVGVVGMELSRADFYQKELSFQVSCSYGPGRYDPVYEEQGQDYPFGLVRWTEQRNFEAVLDLLAERRLDFSPLITHRFPIDQAGQAYTALAESAPLGLLLGYPATDIDLSSSRVVSYPDTTAATGTNSPALGFIGTGNYATAVLIPAFAKAGAYLHSAASASGVSAVHVARKFGFAQATTDTRSMLADPSIAAVVVTTRHNSHADLVCSALDAGKHVFVEKPLALNEAELARVTAAHAAHPELLLTVGFNRRYAPHAIATRQLLARRSGSKTLVMTVNAGAIPADHWTQDPVAGGGRIIGEACHFIDLLRFLVGARITDVKATAMGGTPPFDTVSITLSFADGSIGLVNYFANGSKALAKERLEIFSDGSVLQLDNFRALRGYGWKGLRNSSSWRQDKGQINCARAFVDAIRRGDAASLIPYSEIDEVTRACFSAAAQIGS